MSHLTPLRVRFSELDPYGHVNHAVYVTYLEVGRTEALEYCGIPLGVMAERGYQMVVTKLDVRFRQPAETGDRLLIETSMTNMRRASGTWSQRILRSDPGRAHQHIDPAGADVLVTAEVTAAVTDRSGRPTKPPGWLFPALAPLRKP